MSDLGTGKSIVVCAVVLGCFAVLWPKIFYPMFYGGTFDDRNARENYPPPHPRPERPIHMMSPDMMPPSMRESSHKRVSTNEEVRRTIDKDLRPGPVPGMRPTMGGPGIQPQLQRQGQGAMGILMPLYTVGIVIFFVYTIMKLMFKKDENNDNFRKKSHSLHNDLLRQSKSYSGVQDNYQNMAQQKGFNVGTGNYYKDDVSSAYTDEIADQQEIVSNLSHSSTTEGEDVAQEELAKLPSPTEQAEAQNDLPKDNGKSDPRDLEIELLKKKLDTTEKAMNLIISQLDKLPVKLENLSPLKKIFKVDNEGNSIYEEEEEDLEVVTANKHEAIVEN